MSERTRLLEFPCSFPIKAVGNDDGGFEQLVVAIIQRHIDASDAVSVRTRPSRGGRYLAVTITISAQSQGQLDAIYRDLSACTEVIMAL